MLIWLPDRVDMVAPPVLPCVLFVLLAFSIALGLASALAFWCLFIHLRIQIRKTHVPLSPHAGTALARSLSRRHWRPGALHRLARASLTARRGRFDSVRRIWLPDRECFNV